MIGAARDVGASGRLVHLEREADMLNVRDCAVCGNSFTVGGPTSKSRRCAECLFWAMVDRSGGPDSCWPWLGSLNHAGYGRGRFMGRMSRTHRVAWGIANGDAGPLQVLHRCDANYPVGDPGYRRCCNPAHLFLGTHAENMADMTSKGRRNPAFGDAHHARRNPGRLARGAASGKSALTDESVSEMRRLRADGWLLRELSHRFGVSTHSVNEICHRRTWRHVG